MKQTTPVKFRGRRRSQVHLFTCGKLRESIITIIIWERLYEEVVKKSL